MRKRPIVPTLAILLTVCACGSSALQRPGGSAADVQGGSTASAQGGRTWTRDRPGYLNPIPAENARPGEASWNVGRDSTTHEVELYADRLSARAGETVTVMASVSVAQNATWALYRIGWYGGTGARRVDQGGPVWLSHQAPCPPSSDTALVRCTWTPSFEVHLAADALSGLYAVRVTRDDGFFALTPVVVVDDRPADLLLQASVTTWQAYNGWNGESLYMDATGTMPAGEAIQVSFDRPYETGGGLGRMLWDDANFARFLEHHGYDVSYTTNARIAARGATELLRAGVFLSSSHDEYWAGEERAAADEALAAGEPLLFFGANPAYWKVRLDSAAEPENPRVITCYKGRTQFDPVQDADITGRFRDPPINEPENALVGAMYESWMNLAQRWVVADATSWLFEGTGLANGDALPFLVGYEYDRTFDNGSSPPGLTVLARSPVVTAEGVPSWSETVTYRASSGALVFGAGTMVWTTGLAAGERGDPRVERMTANVLREALALPIPSTVPSLPALAFSVPRGPFATSVGTLATGLVRPTGVAVLPDGSLAVLETGRNRVVRVTLDGNVTLIAGDGSADPPGDGPGATARFSAPTGILALPDGTLLVADSHHDTIRRVGTDAQRTVTTVAGVPGQASYADGSGGAARFNVPMGLVQDPVTGKVLVADNANNRIRAVDLATGNVTTVAGGAGGPMDVDGPGTTARMLQPSALAVAPPPDGRVFIVVTGGYRIKAMLPDAARTVATLAGSYEGFADGSGTEARLEPQGGAAFRRGEMIFADPGSLSVRALAPGTNAAASTVHTVAGSGRSASDDGAATSASFTLPLGVAAGADGTVYVSDAASGSIRVIRW